MRILLLLLLSLALLPNANADIYKYVDRYGAVHLSDRKLGPGYKRIVKSAHSSSRGSRASYQHIVNAAAQRYGLNQELIHAVIYHESHYDPNAVSTAGAIGLMQLMPGTARELGVRDARDPYQNIMGGAQLLRRHIDQFKNLRLALAAYNAGHNAVERYGNRIPPFPETQTYVTRVVATFKKNSRANKRKGMLASSYH